MTVLNRLASALDRNDEVPNIELAERLAHSDDIAAISELVDALSNAPMPLRKDAIKVLYELGERRPDLLAPHVEALLAGLGSSNYRLVWGSLAGLDAIASVVPEALDARLATILSAADKGSVIARDRAVSILTKLTAAGFGARSLPLLLARLEGRRSINCRCTWK
jgi:hypothetical protein